MTRNDLAGWLFVLLLIFLFKGEPNVWDRLHAKAMATLATNSAARP